MLIYRRSFHTLLSSPPHGRASFRFHSNCWSKLSLRFLWDVDSPNPPGSDPRAAHLVRSVDSRGLGCCGVFWPPPRTCFSLRCAHFPEAHPSQDANIIPLPDRIYWQFWGSRGALHNRNVGSACRDFRLASDLHRIVREHGIGLVLLAQA